MIILDKPYVSDYLQKLLIKKQYHVLENDVSRNLSYQSEINITPEEEFIKIYKDKRPPLYSNSENSIGWMAKKLENPELMAQINIFKDKVEFRKFIKEIYPEFYFIELDMETIKNVKDDKLKYPLILKPAVGFFSMGVHRIDNKEEWDNAVELICEQMSSLEGLYPQEVMDSSKFIVEEVIEGTEYAIDAYISSDGKPVILNILKHSFGSAKDTSDRVYSCGCSIMKEMHDKVMPLLKKIGDMAQLRNFPFHIELRVDDKGFIAPIELNPMRFAGWCVTDISGVCVGLDTYQYFVEQLTPDWDEIYKGKENSVYSLVLIDMPEDIKSDDVESFDYEKLLAEFSNVLELRKIDFKEYPVFAFVFIETDSEDSDELTKMLTADIREYIKLK